MACALSIAATREPLSTLAVRSSPAKFSNVTTARNAPGVLIEGPDIVMCRLTTTDIPVPIDTEIIDTETIRGPDQNIVPKMVM